MRSKASRKRDSDLAGPSFEISMPSLLRISEGSAEIQCPIVLPLRAERLANPGVSKFRMEQIRSVRRTMHPTVHHCSRRLLSFGNVLGDEARILIAEVL